MRKETATDIFDFVQYLHVIDDILATVVVAAMLLAMVGYAYPEVKRVACRVLVKAEQRGEYYRGYRG